MNFPEVGSVAFVIALVAFFTTQFKLQGKAALACAFGMALLFNLAPIVAQAYPAGAPVLDVVLKTVLLAISAAGGYDFITGTVKKINAPAG